MRVTRHYILDEHGNPKLETDLTTWANWYENANRHIGQDWINGMQVSTVFLGLDQAFPGHGEPLLWETMIFEMPDDESYQERYSTREEALVGHAHAVKFAKELATSRNK